MTAIDSQALHDSDEYDTKEELVVFDNVLARYSPGGGITVGYSLGSRVCPTPVDWIGIFGSECRDARRPVTFQWVPINKADRECSQHRFLTFHRRLIEPLQHPTDSYRLMYIHKHMHVLGVSLPFLVHDNTISSLPKLTSPTSVVAGTPTTVDTDERATAVRVERAAPEYAERATFQPHYQVTVKHGEPAADESSESAAAEMKERASAGGYVGWNTINSQLFVSPDWDNSVRGGRRRPSPFSDLSDAVALPTRPCLETGPTHDREKAAGSETAHVNAAGPNLTNSRRETHYCQPWSCRELRGNLAAGCESSCCNVGVNTCKGNMSTRVPGQNNRPLNIILDTHYVTGISAQQQISNKSTQPRQREATATQQRQSIHTLTQQQQNIHTLTQQQQNIHTLTQQQQIIHTLTQQQQNIDTSTERQQTTYTCTQRQQKSPLTQTVSQGQQKSPLTHTVSQWQQKSPLTHTVSQRQQKSPLTHTVSQWQQKSPLTHTVSENLVAETPSNLMSLTLLQQSRGNFDGGRLHAGQDRHARCSLDNTQVNTDKGDILLSITGSVPRISRGTPEECRQHKQVRPTIIGREIPAHGTILKHVNNAAQLVRRTEEDTQCNAAQLVRRTEEDTQCNAAQLVRRTEEDTQYNATQLVRRTEEDTQYNDTSLNNEQAENASEDTKEENSRSTHTRQPQQQQTCLSEDKHGCLLQKLQCHDRQAQLASVRPHLQSSGHRTGQVVTAGRALSLYQKIRMKKKRKEPLQTNPGTKVNSGVSREREVLQLTPIKLRCSSVRRATGNSTTILSERSHLQALLTSRCGQPKAVSENTVTGGPGSVPQRELDQDGHHLTHHKMWDTPTEGDSRLRFSEVIDSSVQPLTSAQPLTSVQTLTTVQPLTTVQALTTVQPLTSAQPLTTVQALTTVQTLTTVQALTSVQSADAISRNCPSSRGPDTAARCTRRVPDVAPGQHPDNTSPQCAVTRALNARICSRDLEMAAARQTHTHIKDDTGMLLRCQAIASLRDTKTQKELQNSFMREVQNLHDKPNRDSDNEPMKHVLYSGIAAHRSQSAEFGPACSDLSTCAPCVSPRLHVDQSVSDNMPQAGNHRGSLETRQGPSENMSVEVTCCDKLEWHDDRLSEKDNKRDSLSCPLPEFATTNTSLGHWATQKKMKYLPENYTKHELPFEGHPHQSQQPFTISRSANLEPRETTLAASGDMGRHSQQVLTEAEKKTRAGFLYGALMTSLAENMELREKLELVQFELTEQTVQLQREQQQKAASVRRVVGRNRLEMSTVRHRRLPLVKYAGTIKNSVRCQEQILSLKSKVKDDDLLIRELNSQLVVLKDTLNTESRKLDRAHLKLLKLKKQMKEYKENMGTLKRRQQMANIDTHMEAFPRPRALAVSLGGGDCRGVEPPLKKPRLALPSDDVMAHGTETTLHPPMSDVGSMWKQQSCPLSKEAYHAARRLPSDENQLTRDFSVVTSQHSTSGSTRNSTFSAFCHGSGFVSAFNATQQAGPRWSCINAWSRGHLDPVVTPCHHNIIASCVGPVGSHRDKLPDTGHKQGQQQTSSSCCSSQTWTRSHPSSECYTGCQPPKASPPGGHCCCSSGQYQREKQPCPGSYDSLACATRHSACQQQPNSGLCEPALLPVMLARFPQRSPLSCNNSRNRSRDSSASDCQYISPLPSPSLLPLPASHSHWSGRGRRSSPRNEIVIDNYGSLDSDSATQQCVNSYVRESVQPCHQPASVDQQDSTGTDQYDSNLYWPSKSAQASENYGPERAVYNPPDGGATCKHGSCATEDGSMVTVPVAPFHVSPTSVESEQFKDSMFAYASGATVCPEGNSVAQVSDSVCKMFTAADDEGINNQLLGIFTTPQQVTHHGQGTSAMLHNMSASLMSAKDQHQDSMYSHFQSCFLSHLGQQDSHKLQNNQLQDHSRLLGHNHHRQREYVQKPDQTQQRPQKVYRYPRTPLSLPPSELPYPPLSPFHHATSTQARKTRARLLSDTDVEQHSSSILSEPASGQRLPHSAFHGSHHSLGECVLELAAASGMKQDDPFAIRRLLGGRDAGDHPGSYVDLRTQSVRQVLNESALLASEALVASHVDDRQIEASPACQLNPHD